MKFVSVPCDKVQRSLVNSLYGSEGKKVTSASLSRWSSGFESHLSRYEVQKKEKKKQEKKK